MLFIKAPTDIPLKVVELKAATPTDRCLDVMLMDGPSNSSLWTSLSMVFRALRTTGGANEQHQQTASGRSRRDPRGTHVVELGASAVSELFSMLEMMVTTLKAKALLMFTASTSSLIVVTTCLTCEGAGGGGVTLVAADKRAHVLLSHLVFLQLAVGDAGEIVGHGFGKFYTRKQPISIVFTLTSAVTNRNA